MRRSAITEQYRGHGPGGELPGRRPELNCEPTNARPTLSLMESLRNWLGVTSGEPVAALADRSTIADGLFSPITFYYVTSPSLPTMTATEGARSDPNLAPTGYPLPHGVP